MADQGGAVAEQGAGGGGAAEGAQAPAAVDLSPVLDQLGQLGDRLGGFEAQLQQLGQPAEEPAEEGFDLEALYDQDNQLDGQAVLQMLGQLQESQGQSTQQAIEAAMAPIVQRVEDMQIDRDAETLIEAFPQLADPKVAEASIAGALAKAQELGIDQAYARRPGFITLVMKAQQAEQQAAGEVPVGDVRQHELEAGAGAAPAGGGSEPSVMDRIAAARRGNSFWGA